MTTGSLIVSAGWLMIASGLILGFSYISHPHAMPPEVIASPGWFVIHLLFALSLVFGLLATTVLYACTALRLGKVAMTGFVMLFVGMMMIFGLNYYEVFIAPFLAENYPKVIVDYGAGDTMGLVALVFPLSGSLTVVGYALLGFAWYRGGSLPRWIGLGLVATALAFGVGLSPVGGIEIARVGAALFGLALTATGVWAVRHPARFSGDNGDTVRD